MAWTFDAVTQAWMNIGSASDLSTLDINNHREGILSPCMGVINHLYPL